jgi:hypothetical protein
MQRHHLLRAHDLLSMRFAGWALLGTLACAHGSSTGTGADLELVAFPHVAPEVATSLIAEVKRQEPKVRVEDVTALWESLFVVAAPPRFRTFTEAPPPEWPKALESSWAAALNVCRERLGAEPDLLGKPVALCNAQLIDVLWNQILANRNARGSVAVSVKDLKTGEVELDVVRILSGATAAYTHAETALPDAVGQKAFGLVHACFAEKPSAPRLNDLKVPEGIPANPPAGAAKGPPPPEHNPRLETKLSASQMPHLDLGPACDLRPGTLLIDAFLAPTFSHLLEQRWVEAHAGTQNAIECALTGEYERRAGASALPLNVNAYVLDCNGRIAKTSVVTEDERWPEHASRRLLLQLSEQFCPH